MSLTKLYIDERVAGTPEVLSIRSRLNLPVEPVADVREVFEWISAAADPIQRAKESLFLTRNRGAFIRKCPGTREYTCCGYMILHIGTFCTMDCSYCILQSYFHPPVLQFFVNHDDMLAELDRAFEEKAFRRIGTGEFTDSMIWDLWTDFSTVLVSKFAQQSHMMLELKTKTTAIDNLRGLDHRRRTAVAWSVNTEAVIRVNERGTASLTARLKAAARCESWGYPVAFHFDPMVIYEGCEADYQQVVEQIFSHVSPDNVLWISIGTFRFMPGLKPVVQKRFPDSKIVYGEFISGLDEKMRYFKPLRIHLYQAIYSRIRAIAPDVRVYFCMEDDEVWQKSLGFVPEERGGLPEMLDQSAITHCELKAG
ncbi:DNA photolyase [Desulfonema ishimotonii]|uniref:DNA photolyase n=1 Tax=Desulfonema ishimotonii TaxID=45657 RepID=A0A401FV27_9BACT|nr:DNA photolyase [Desulfonema ishimotonii]GBC60821.1 DNA photolyase [Desulfonema ishimotonii]